MTRSWAARALMPHDQMTRRDWWLGVVVAVIAVVLLLFPLYQWRADTAERTVEDTGEELGLVEGIPPEGAASVPDFDALSGGVEIQVPLPIVKSGPFASPDEMNDLSRSLACVSVVLLLRPIYFSEFVYHFVLNNLTFKNSRIYATYDKNRFIKVATTSTNIALPVAN